MAGSSKASIPEWQRQGAAAASAPSEQKAKQEPQSDNEPSSSSSDSQPPPSRAELLDQAASFLEHEDIRDASTDRKIAFLESKGLNNDEIQQLLGVSRNVSASAPQPPPPPSTSSDEAAVEPSSMTASIPDPTIPEATSDSPPSSAAQAPPIITYPEFLLHAARPAPLVTTQRVLTTLYTTAATAAILHGAHTYLFTPMLDSLNAARHTLFDATAENLSTMNSKLRSSVSSVPASAILATQQAKTTTAHHHQRNDSQNDADSEASDPTELFHVDAGVQTDDRNLSLSSTLNNNNRPPAPLPKSTLTQHTDCLRELKTLIEDVDAETMRVEAMRDNARDEVRALADWLEDVRFGRGTGRPRGFGVLPQGMVDPVTGQRGTGILPPAPVTPYVAAASGKSRSGAGGPGMVLEEEVDRCRKSIREVKGLLLSARSFPMGSTVGRGGGGMGGTAGLRASAYSKIGGSGSGSGSGSAGGSGSK